MNYKELQFRYKEGGLLTRGHGDDSGADIRAIGFRRIRDEHEYHGGQRIKVAGTLQKEVYFKTKGESVIIHPHETVLLLTGTACKLPTPIEVSNDGKKITDKSKNELIGHMVLEAQVRPRSGLSLKMDFHAHLGTIDNSYRGDMGVIVTNVGDEAIMIKNQERIGQIVFQHVYVPILEKVEVVEEFEEETTRGEGGYGSTGTE